MSKKTKKEQKKAPQETASCIKQNAVHHSAPVMPLGNICPDPKNGRKQEITPENDPRLLELVDSIKQFGDVIEPIVVRLRPEEDLEGDYFPDCRYMIISGHRRFAAAKLAELQTVHCSVWENISDSQAFEMQLIENLHRADLQPVEEAEAYKRMKEELGYNYAEIALRVGKSEKHIGRYIKLLTLPGKILNDIDNGDLTLSKALYFCSLNEKVMNEILSSNWYSSWLRNSYSFKEFKERVLREFIVDLSNEHIKFDLKMEYTTDDGDVLPACTKCPHKKQMALFDEFDNKGQCPYGPCFKSKQDLIEEPEEDDILDQETPEMEGLDDKKETLKQKEQREQYERDRKIRLAVEKTKALYYIDKKIAQGFSVKDIDFYLCEGNAFQKFDCLSTDDIYLKYLGKDEAAIKESNDYELIVKALIINNIIWQADGYNEDELAELLGCEQCPEELLETARNEVMGIKKK